ncbi:MAG: hypothetical protein QOJ29_3621 [Thermoleophilaceae bacterium]|jgi:hypothetical protein|nr:hypothetical protein [Thermoleophilaceae bacterium]
MASPLIGRGGVVLALMVASALALAARSVGDGADNDPKAVAREFGVPAPAWRLKPSRSVAGYQFAAFEGADGVPCLAYSGDRGGGSCFVAVGQRGGWALEARVMSTAKAAFVIGVAVPATRRVRLGDIGRTVRTLAPQPEAERFGVRYFVAAVPRRALKIKPNSIVALDSSERLLGRQHYCDARDRCGPRDGRWEMQFDHSHSGTGR